MLGLATYHETFDTVKKHWMYLPPLILAGEAQLRCCEPGHRREERWQITKSMLALHYRQLCRISIRCVATRHSMRLFRRLKEGVGSVEPF